MCIYIHTHRYVYVYILILYISKYINIYIYIHIERERFGNGSCFVLPKRWINYSVRSESDAARARRRAARAERARQAEAARGFKKKWLHGELLFGIKQVTDHQMSSWNHKWRAEEVTSPEADPEESEGEANVLQKSRCEKIQIVSNCWSFKRLWSFQDEPSLALVVVRAARPGSDWSMKWNQAECDSCDDILRRTSLFVLPKRGADIAIQQPCTTHNAKVYKAATYRIWIDEFRKPLWLAAVHQQVAGPSCAASSGWPTVSWERRRRRST